MSLYPLHQISWTHTGDGLSGTVTCTQTDGAWCRLVCPLGCETWTPEHEHPLEDAGSCQVVTSLTLDSDTALAACTEPLEGRPVVNGWIQPTWEHDFIGWHYADHPLSLRPEQALDWGVRRVREIDEQLQRDLDRIRDAERGRN